MRFYFVKRSQDFATLMRGSAHDTFFLADILGIDDYWSISSIYRFLAKNFIAKKAYIRVVAYRIFAVFFRLPPTQIYQFTNYFISNEWNAIK